MPFQPFSLQRWIRGATLVSEPDQIPDDALRIASNVRLDRTLGAIEVRPGWTAQTLSAVFGSIVYLSRLFTSVAAYGYVHAASTLYRLNSSWGNATNIATPGNQVVSDANSPDGSGNLLKYFVNGTLAIKDTGTVVTQIGIAPPSAPPLASSLAPDLTTLIGLSLTDTAPNWTGTNLASGPSDDFQFVQAPVSSVTFSIAASTPGNIAIFNSPLTAGPVNLDTLPGGDNLVKQDDYIHLWVRIDFPERLTFFQLDIDCDGSTTGVGDAFRRNYYSIRLGALVTFAQGSNQWTKLEIRKSKFARYGTDTSRSWVNARAFRIGFLTNTQGTVNIWVNDFKLRGGVGMEGDIEYTVCYRSNVTFARGNPPKNAAGVPQYTTKLVTNRQRINLQVSNVREGGENHPGDSQIDRMMIWRRGGSFVSAVHVATIPDTHESPYLDNTSDETLILDAKNLELDNDMPPTGTTRILFGPSATGHFFMIVDGYRLYISKPYERLENRVENWPAASFALIGDGSARAVAGIASSTQIRVWTTERSYNVVGVGTTDDTFLPVALDGSRGCVGQFAVCEGDSTLFFIAQDGIYADRGGHQIKLTAAIDPFFQGLTVSGQAGWNTALMSLARLGFLHEPTGSALIMLYADSSSTILNSFLVLKPAGGAVTLTQPFSIYQTALATECFFGTSALTSLQSLYLDNINRELLAGAANGHVYRIENPTAYSDAGTAITWHARTKSLNQGQPFERKQYASVLAEGNTSGQSLALAAYYNRADFSETLSSTWSSSAENGQVSFRTIDETALRYNIALDIVGSTTDRVAITGFVIHAFPHPELQLIHDTNEFMFQTIHELRKVPLDLNTPSPITMVTYLNGTPSHTQIIAATSGRQRVDVEYPLGLRSKLFRIRWVSSAGAELWEASAWLRPEPEDVLLWDSDEVYFELVQQLKLFTFDIDAPANVIVNLYIDGILKDTRPIIATSGRTGVRHVLPAGLVGKEFRTNLVSLTRFQIWDLNGWFKPLGGAVGYQPVAMTKRQLAQVIQKLI